MKKNLIAAALVTAQLLSLSAQAEYKPYTPDSLGKAKLAFCSLWDKQGRTVQLQMSRGDWAVGGNYAMVISFMDTQLFREDMRVAGNHVGHVYKTASMTLTLTPQPKQSRYETNVPAKGTLTVTGDALRHFKPSQDVNCEFASKTNY
ncbi:MAG: hypothetical protein H7061_06850 [Bdellovibrionaceae bacterium]|nr:hypothetical protein [Bdellovibrio sp.]